MRHDEEHGVFEWGEIFVHVGQGVKGRDDASWLIVHILQVSEIN